MSFKDFVAFTLKMTGFWLVISTIVGISQASFLFMTGAYLTEFGNQTSQILVSILVPIAIGLLLVLMPYKVADFMIKDDVKFANTETLYRVLTRVGIALVGLYITATGLQYIVYNWALFHYMSVEYTTMDNYAGNKIAAMYSQAARILVGVCIVIGSKSLSLILSKLWVNAKK